MTYDVAKTVGKGVFWFSGGTIFLKLLGIASIFIVLSHLSLYEYGLVELSLSLVPLLSFFTLPGLSLTITADMSADRGRGDLPHMYARFKGFFVYQVVLGFCAWAVIFWGADILAKFYHTQSILLIKAVSFLFLISPLRTMITVLLTVDLKYFEQSLLSVGEELFKFGLISFFILGLGMRADGLVYATILSQFGALFIVCVPALKSYKVFSRSGTPANFSFIRYVGAHGKWGVLLSYLGNVNQKVWVWIIKAFVGTEAVGLFAVAQGLIGHTLSLVPLSRVVTPILPQYIDNENKFFKLASKSIKYQFLVNVVLAVVAAVTFPPVLAYLFPNFEPALTLFVVMLLSLLPISFDSIFVPMFYAAKAQRDLFGAALFKMLLIIILTPLCLIWFGAIGSAYAFNLVVLLYTANRYWALKRILPRFKIRFADFIGIDENDRMVLQQLYSPIRAVITRLGIRGQL